jgi:hypothetical protein
LLLRVLHGCSLAVAQDRLGLDELRLLVIGLFVINLVGGCGVGFLDG